MIRAGPSARPPSTHDPEELLVGLYTLPDLPYDYGALEPHYLRRDPGAAPRQAPRRVRQGRQRRRSRSSPRRATRATSRAIVGLEKTLAFNLSGHVLHSIFWKNLVPRRRRPARRASWPRRSTSTSAASTAFKAQLTDGDRARVQGSGWGVLAWEPLGQRLIVEQVYDHQGNVGQGGRRRCWSSTPGSTPTTCSTGTCGPTTSTRLWNLVNWADVTARFDAARSATPKS